MLRAYREAGAIATYCESETIVIEPRNREAGAEIRAFLDAEGIDVRGTAREGERLELSDEGLAGDNWAMRQALFNALLGMLGGPRAKKDELCVVLRDGTQLERPWFFTVPWPRAGDTVEVEGVAYVVDAIAARERDSEFPRTCRFIAHAHARV